MKKVLMSSAVAITLLTLLLASIRCHKHNQYASVHDMPFWHDYMLHDTLRVAFIGDSWAFFQEAYDSLLLAMLCSANKSSAVLSKGFGGEKSKEIYERLNTTTRQVLNWHPDYCVISAGINDAVTKQGSSYYSYHYMLIIRQLLNARIKPVVLDMPEVNYQGVAEREPWFIRCHHYMSAIINGSELYSFESYRDGLLKSVSANGLLDSIIYVKASAWNPDGYRDARGLYMPDETHLNALGYHLLDSCIAAEILKDWNIRKCKTHE